MRRSSILLRRFAMIALAPAAFVGIVALASPAQAASTGHHRPVRTPATQVTTATMESDVVTLTNQQRAQNGCAPVTVDSRITTAARAHSAWMAGTGSFSHVGNGGSTFDARIRAAGYATPRSENIAWGYRSGAEVMDGWMNSAGHRANILDCSAKTVGVGIAYASNGNPYFTEDFGV
jgi:uncharacterized protein YkwD